MEILERQKELIIGTVTTLFDGWQQQLNEKTTGYDLLKQEVKSLHDKLVLQSDTITCLQNENVHLHEEVMRLQAASGPDDSPRLRALIEKHNDLYKEHELQKATAAANERDLIRQLRREREKLRGWNRFSSPGPPLAHLSVPVASNNGQPHLDSTDASRSRSEPPGDRDPAEGLSLAQENISHGQFGPDIAGKENSRNTFNDVKGLHDLQSSTDTVKEDKQASSDFDLTKQPQNTTVRKSLFVDAHLPHNPRPSSPELPSMPEKQQLQSPIDNGLSAETQKAVSQGSLPQIRRSDSTAPPSEGPVIVEVDDASVVDAPDSDTPEFLGARPVKKNASGEAPPVGKPAAGSAIEPVTIKSDPDTSFVANRPPQLTKSASSTHESLDPSTSRTEQSSPWKQRSSLLLPSTSSKEASRQSLALLETFMSKHANSERMSGEGSRTTLAQASKCQTPARSNAESAAPLRQIDGNARRPQRSIDPKSRKRKSDDSRGVEAIPTIAEDGEDFTNKARKKAKDHVASPHLTNSSIHQRLGNLLTEQSGQKPILKRITEQDIDQMDECLWEASRCCAYSDKKPFRALKESDDKDWDWWDEAKQLLSRKHDRTPSTPPWHPAQVQQRRPAQRVWNDRTPKPKPTLTSKPTPPSSRALAIFAEPRHKATPTATTTSRHPAAPTPLQPYRTLPLSLLTPSHFKLQPHANHSLTYAYTDVIRNQSARKCLPGCTRPACCGPKFAALAKTLPPQHAPHPNTAPAPAAAAAAGEEEEEEEEEEEGDTDLQSRTAQFLANKYGKAHRTLHPRAQSPPGFWNVDFPGTQEREADRREAEERERAEVERRWREAVKNGRGGRGGAGLWKFADE